jgi:ABC-type nitrate/sulfonate/bicarbonate transport system substrate-binding protein
VLYHNASNLQNGCQHDRTGELMPLLSKPLCAAVLVAVVFVPSVAFSEDSLKLAVGAPNNWDSGVSEIGQRAGIFGRHGLNLEILYTNRGGETMQAVISGGESPPGPVPSSAPSPKAPRSGSS